MKAGSMSKQRISVLTIVMRGEGASCARFERRGEENVIKIVLFRGEHKTFLSGYFSNTSTTERTACHCW